MPITVKVTFGTNQSIEATANNIEEIAELLDRTSKKFFGVGIHTEKKF
jgi:hypothetical protein